MCPQLSTELRSKVSPQVSPQVSPELFSKPQATSPIASRTTADRCRMAVGFELVGLLLLVPISSVLLDKPALELGGLAVLMSLIATGWNYQFNLWFDRFYLHPRGRQHKTQPERSLHALLFELGLLAVFLPLTAWYLTISLWQAFWLDLGFMLFYLVYGYLYHWAYDLLFPIKQQVPTTVLEHTEQSSQRKLG